MLCQKVPDVAKFPILDYMEAVCLSTSRTYDIGIDGAQARCFVPFADMFNHKNPRQTKWSFDKERKGFVITALEDIFRG